MIDWMRSEGVNYITPCGHKKASHGEQAALPAQRVEERGEGRLEPVGRDDERGDGNG